MTPSLGFRGQPFAEAATTAAFVRQAAADQEIQRLTLVVAWTRYRGLGRVKRELEDFKRRGGHLRIVLGIDEGGATRPGLLLAARLADDARVFHHPGGGTFHPKLYLAEGPAKAQLLVGSSNATPGGLFSNYEASLEAQFRLPAEDTHPALAGARRYIERLLAEQELCISLTEDLVDRLVRDPRYAVEPAERPRRRGVQGWSGAGTDDDADQSGSSGDGADEASLFGRRVSQNTTPPPLSPDARRELNELELDQAAPAGSGTRPPRGAAGDTPAATPRASDSSSRRPQGSTAVRQRPTVIKRWYKRLPRADAQQLPTSSPSAALTLVQGGHPIDRNTYFRRNFFQDMTWRQDAGKEIAAITCDVVVDGANLGQKQMVLVHDPNFEAGQNNRTTLLRWGELQGYLRHNDHTGKTVTLERLSDGGCRVTIAATETGPFRA